MLRLNRLAFTLLACCLYLFSAAQTTNCSADFAYSVGNNKVVSFFTKDSAGTTHRWLFGDGTAALITANGTVTHQYAQPGKYEVKHRIEKPNSNCRDSAVKIIVVEWRDTCHAGFEWKAAPTVPPGSPPFIYQFTSTSQASSDIKSFKWTFGDGSSSDDKNPVHTYLHAGSYSVCLRIETGTGCISELCKELVITTDNCNITARYEWKRDSADCKKIHFINLSNPASSSVHFIWKFGDGNTSQDANPTHVYAQPGKYYVCLVTEAGLNCRREYCDSVKVNCDAVCNITAKFEWKKDSADCKKIRFINLSAPIAPNTHFAWKFGDGDGSYDANPSHVYSKPGKYQVCLVADAGNNCVKYYCDSVTVRCEETCNIQPSFSWKADEAIPEKIYFKNLTVSSSAAVHYIWKFGDNSSSNDISPVHVYGRAGKYTVCLIAEISNLCRKEICQDIEVKACDVVARFETKHDPAKWNTVYFSNVSKPVSNIWQTYWSYGDGASSRDYNSFHSYDKPGVYNVCLKVISLGGCISAYCDTVRVVKTDSCEGRARFSHYSSSTIAGLVKFEALYQSNTARYYWNYGDNMAGLGRITSHVYNKSGKYKVCLTVKDGQCSVTHCEEITIEKGANGGRLAVFPNPAVNTVSFDVSLESPGQVSISIIDGSGALKAQYSKSGSSGDNRFTLPVEKLSPGIYLVEIKSGSGVWFSRFIKA